MTKNRAEIERRLRTAEEDGDHLDAEAYRAWLALDAAPIGVVEYLNTGTCYVRCDASDIDGQIVRLVATPASGGPRDG